ncbi:hypothetical protein [Hydrogenophaga sp. BPS33]|uniref:hypothetical protein n=1 Tax=Hydrogenophaga sp. BPS33 TaxID=2651974 RepID=UPI00131FCAC3|nr:hypothetical protein [Hydrogenophaga sp. BPS33]QHE87228.1 hypothetical protein F9K07_21170 [Hydrogenophaga sp. BPS33]
MKSLGKEDHATTTIQNKVRGLVSAYRSKKFIIDRRDDPLRDLRIGIRHQFLDARAVLSQTQFEPFIQWVDTQLTAQATDYFRTSSSYDDLAGVHDAPVVPLERELTWLTARLKALKDRVNTFLQLKELVELSTMARGYEDAIRCISQIEKFLGCSMWSVQMRIALEHQAGGLERQKKYVSEVRSVFRSGLLGFVAYHTSVRNEDKTTSGKFIDDICGRIERNPKYSDGVKTYLKCILAQEWPQSEDKLSEILRVAQSHSFADMYESLIGVSQVLIRNGVSGGTRTTLLRCLSELSRHVRDVRIGKALFILTEGDHEGTLHQRNTTLSDSLFLANTGRRVRKPFAPPHFADPWFWIYSGFQRAIIGASRNRVLRQPADLPLLLGRVLNQRNQEEDSLAHISKLNLNFSGLRVITGLSEFSQILRVLDVDQILSPHFVGLNSPTFGIEDVPLGAQSWSAYRQRIDAIEDTPTKQAWQIYLDGTAGEEGTPEEKPETSAVTLLRAIRLFNTKDFSRASDVLQRLTNDKRAIDAHSLVTTLQLRALSNYGARKKLIELVAYEGTKGHQSASILPINQLFERYQWEDFASCSDSVSASIALQLWLAERDNEEVLSWLRFATAKFLKISDCRLPSRLIDSAERPPSCQLIYFLKNVCTTSILDVSRVLKGTRQVLEERQAIFAALRELDPQSKEEYQDEISSIGNDLALQEGQSIVDQSRIHVDAIALKKWAVRELAEDFERYLDLLKVDLRQTKDFDEIVKELLDGNLPRDTFTPENEADALLYSMLRRIAEEFLLNPTFGFDFYLSKRVRHQSFIGLIRGPLEFSNLITTRESEGSKYRDNTYWMEKFVEIGTSGADQINELLLRFGARFDDILFNAKNNLFHVRSAEKPIGLLGVELTSQHIMVVRALVHPDEEVGDFVDTALAMIWASLEHSLIAVRKLIADDIQIKIAAYFDELKAGVRKIADTGESLVEFNAQVGQSSAEVQRALDDASRWFARASHEAQMRLFSLEQVVKVGVDSALKAQRAFNPEIETSVHGSMSLRASALVFVHDVFLVALDNVRSYSGLKQPKVKILVEIGPSGDELRIEVRSQTKGNNRSENERRMGDIRQAIASQAIGQRTRKEGLSGFIKIAAVTSQSSKGRISFGYASDEEFVMSVTYSLVVIAEEGDEDV